MTSLRVALHAIVDELNDEQAQQTLEFARRLQRHNTLKSLDEAKWRREFEALLTRIQARTATFSSEELEADITVAAREVEDARRVRRGSQSWRRRF